MPHIEKSPHTFVTTVTKVRRLKYSTNGNPRWSVEFEGLCGVPVRFRTKTDVIFSSNLSNLEGEWAELTLHKKKIIDARRVKGLTLGASQ